jgi:DNA polymerase-3 subunit epsilon
MISARRQAIQVARQKLLLQPLYLDTETTGLGRDSEIVEICILDDQGQVIFESLVRPLRPIPPDAIQIHGITNAMVKDAPDWISVWSTVEPILAGRHVGIYNAEFDLRMLQQTHQNYRMRWPHDLPFQPFCIMRLYAQYYGEWNSQRGSYRWHSLDVAGRQCRIPLPNSHRARDDTLLARAILHHIANSE